MNSYVKVIIYIFDIEHSLLKNYFINNLLSIKQDM